VENLVILHEIADKGIIIIIITTTIIIVVEIIIMEITAIEM